MREQLQETVDMFELSEGDDVNEIITSPAQKHLRDIDDECEPLGEEKMEMFHSMVAKLLWIMKSAHMRTQR